MFLQALGAADEDHALVAERLLDVGISRLAIELSLHAREEFALLFRDAEALEGLLHVLGHIVPRTAGLRAATQVVADVLEDDVVEVFGGPMRGHGLFVENIERLVAKLPDPVGLALDLGDVVNRLVRQTGAGVVGVGFRVGKIAGAPVDVDVSFRCGHKIEGKDGFPSQSPCWFE